MHHLTKHATSRRAAKSLIIVASVFTLIACGGSDDPPELDETFTLAGTATGLAGDVQLQANSEALTVSNDGPFAFETNWPDGTQISLSVEQAPASQTCTISPTSVTLAGVVAN